MLYSAGHMASREFLGEFEQIVLLAMLRLGKNAYGVPIRREIDKRTRRAAAIGALYRTLDRLEEKGYVASWFADPTPERGGRSRLELLSASPVARRSRGCFRECSMGSARSIRSRS